MNQLMILIVTKQYLGRCLSRNGLGTLMYTHKTKGTTFVLSLEQRAWYFGDFVIILLNSKEFVLVQTNMDTRLLCV